MAGNKQGLVDLRVLGAWVGVRWGEQGGPHGTWRPALFPPREHSEAQ